MKKFLGLGWVLLVLTVAASFVIMGCAQVTPVGVEGPRVLTTNIVTNVAMDIIVTVTNVNLVIAADVQSDAPVVVGDRLWAVGEMGNALGGTVAFWGAMAAEIGVYGAAMDLTNVVDLATVSGVWGAPEVIDFKILICNGTPGVAPHTELTGGLANQLISVAGPLNVLSNHRPGLYSQRIPGLSTTNVLTNIVTNIQ